MNKITFLIFNFVIYTGFMVFFFRLIEDYKIQYLNVFLFIFYVK